MATVLDLSVGETAGNGGEYGSQACSTGLSSEWKPLLSSEHLLPLVVSVGWEGGGDRPIFLFFETLAMWIL